MFEDNCEKFGSIAYLCCILTDSNKSPVFRRAHGVAASILLSRELLVRRAIKSFMVYLLQNVMAIAVDIEVLSKESADQQTAAVKKVVKQMEGIKSSGSVNAQRLKYITIGGDTLFLQNVRPVGSVTGVCRKGMAFDVVQKKLGEAGDRTCGMMKLLLFFDRYYTSYSQNSKDLRHF